MGMFTRFRFLNGTHTGTNHARVRMKDKTGAEVPVPASGSLSAAPHTFQYDGAPTGTIDIEGVVGVLEERGTSLSMTITAPKGDYIDSVAIESANDGAGNLLGCLIGYTENGAVVSAQMR